MALNESIKWLKDGVEVGSVELGWVESLTGVEVVMTAGDSPTLQGTLSIGNDGAGYAVIGELSYDTASGYRVSWYPGSAERLRLRHGDRLRASLDSPVSITAILDVHRVHMDLPAASPRDMATVADHLGQWLTEPAPLRLATALNEIVARVPVGSFTDSVSPAGIIDTLRRYANLEYDRDLGETLIYPTTIATMEAQSTLDPASGDPDWEWMIDAETNTLYRYINGAWTTYAANGVDVSYPTDIYGTRVFLSSPVTGQKFYIDAIGNITPVTFPAGMELLSYYSTLNPVTGDPIVFDYRVFSPEYGWQALPANLQMSYYAKLTFAGGNYRLIGVVDDRLDIYIDEVYVGFLAAGYAGDPAGEKPYLDVPISAGQHAFRMVNLNLPEGTPGYWFMAIVDMTTGEVVHQPTPGTWTTRDEIMQ